MQIIGYLTYSYSPVRSWFRNNSERSMIFVPAPHDEACAYVLKVEAHLVVHAHVIVHA